LVLWNNLVTRIALVQLVDSEEVFRWNLHQNGQYSVHSLYLAQINNGVVDMNRKLWKVRIPLKNKIFMWYVYKGVVLTKDNLANTIEMGVNNIVSVVKMRAYNTCFLIVIMLDSCED
jgi:hypothetical protein